MLRSRLLIAIAAAVTAAALLDDVWAGASASPLLVITHDPDVRARCDRELVLG